MSIRNTKSANKGGALTVNGTPYTLARSDVFYFLKFIDYDKELFKSASNLTAKPTAVFYTEDAQDKVILDYSLANETDKTYLASFFANMTQTDTFNFTNGSYLDKAELEANVGCTLTYSAFKDSKIFANVNAVTNKNTALDVYFGDYFLGTPQLSKAGGLGSSSATVNYALVSVNPNTNKPLSSLGITYSDIIEVVSTNADNNQIKFEITDVTKLNETEVVKLKPVYSTDVPVLESLVGSTSLVNLYVKGTTTLPQQLSGDLGCCSDTNNNNIENNTEYQCSIRGFSFYPGNCESVVQTSTATTTTQFASRFLLTTENSNFTNLQTTDVIFDSTIQNLNGTTPIFTLKLLNGDSNILVDNKILYRDGIKYAFSQQHVSNIGYVIRFSSTENEFTPFVSGIYGSVTDTGLYSTQFVDTTNFDYPKLYLFIQKTLGISGLTLSDNIKTGYYFSTQ
jgi:hypothetical protein